MEKKINAGGLHREKANKNEIFNFSFQVYELFLFTMHVKYYPMSCETMGHFSVILLGF